MKPQRRARLEKLAKVYDTQVLPVWTKPFGELLMKDFPFPKQGQVLDVTCGTGFPGLDLLKQFNQETRLIAIDERSVLLDRARRKAADSDLSGVFFRTETALPRLSFAANVYNVTYSNLGLAEMPNRVGALADYCRVTVPGGEVRCTLPLKGTYHEFYDLFRQVLAELKNRDGQGRLAEHLRQYPTKEEALTLLKKASLENPRVETTTFELSFASAKEFFFAPAIDHGPLAAWKKIAGKTEAMQKAFFRLKELIDEHCEKEDFKVTVHAGCLIGTKASDHQEDDVRQFAIKTTKDIDEITEITDQLDLTDLEEVESSIDALESGAMELIEVLDDPT